MRNKRVKQMICDVELHRRNGCIPLNCKFAFHNGVFGYFVWISSGRFFRAIYFN